MCHDSLAQNKCSLEGRLHAVTYPDHWRSGVRCTPHLPHADCLLKSLRRNLAPMERSKLPSHGEDASEIVPGIWLHLRSTQRHIHLAVLIHDESLTNSKVDVEPQLPHKLKHTNLVLKKTNAYQVGFKLTFILVPVFETENTQPMHATIDKLSKIRCPFLWIRRWKNDAPPAFRHVHIIHLQHCVCEKF